MNAPRPPSVAASESLAPPAPPAPRARVSLVETSPLITVLCILGVIAVMIRMIRMVPELGYDQVLVDFDAFYIAGQMVWEGAIYQAYDTAVTQARQSALMGQTIFMPWTYPPQFDLVVALLPLAPRWLAYAVFIGVSFALFLWPLSRLAGRYTAGVLMASVPSLCFGALIGQNGFLTGALMGFAALAWMAPRGRAGIPLGLMVIKPHLALTMGLLALVTPRWGVVAWAAFVVIASSLLSTLAFGPGIWTAFLEGTAAAKANLAAGHYPLFRMTSVYAAAHTLNLGASLSLALHASVALIALATVVWAARFSGWRTRRILGFTMLLSLVISPYNYDYDTPIMSIGLAILAADVIERSRAIERLVIMLLAWGAGSAGITMSVTRADSETEIYGETWFPLSVGAYAYLPLLLMVWVILRRIHAEEGRAAAPASEAAGAGVAAPGGYSSPSLSAR